MLHHIYLFLRVVEESTHIYPIDGPLWTSSLSYDKMLFPSLRSFSLRQGKDLDWECGGDFESGLLGELDHNHYQSARAFFGQIYGFPLQLLSFISRSTYLANDRHQFHITSHEGKQTPELDTLITALENDICSWEVSDKDIFQDDEQVAISVSRVIMSSLTAAIHSAVMVFFYRRVRVINPLLLQSYVEKTIANLELFEQEMREFSLINCGIVWPGFIAAAEALEPDLQARAYQLLRRSAASSGMRNFDVAADFVRDLWQLRKEKQVSSLTWVDLVRTKQTNMILT